MNCKKHRHQTATAQCTTCGAYLCERCIARKKVGTKYLDVCSHCNALAGPLLPADDSQPKKGTKTKGGKTLKIPALELNGPKSGAAIPNPHLQEPVTHKSYLELADSPEDLVKKGRDAKLTGDFDRALGHFEAALRLEPENPLALREAFKIHLFKENREMARKTINSLMDIYASHDKKTEALVLFGEVMGVMPRHTFNKNSQQTIAGWLKEISDYKNALIAFRNFAYGYPDDPYAPQALMEAAVITQKELKNQKLAATIFKIITTQYKNTPEALEAMEFLKEIGED